MMMTVIDTPAVIDDRIVRVLAAKAEYASWKSWNTTGRKGPEPSTVNLEAVRNDEPTTTKEKKMSTTPTTKIPVTYYRDGVPMPERYNYLADLGSRSGTSAREITERLAAEQGIDKPKQSTWKLTLPSGMIIGCVVEGDPIPAGLVWTGMTVTAEDKLAKVAAKIDRRWSDEKNGVVEIVQHGKQSFAVNVDGTQHGKRLPSRKQAEQIAATL